MTAEKIAKLRELADRGIGGEKQNARDILTKLGVDWKKPKLNFQDTIKKTFKKDYTRSYQIPIKDAGDVLFIMQLLNKITSKASISITDNRIQFNCTSVQMEDISKIYNKYRQDFNAKMWYESDKYINQYLKTI